MQGFGIYLQLDLILFPFIALQLQLGPGQDDASLGAQLYGELLLATRHAGIEAEVKLGAFLQSESFCQRGRYHRKAVPSCIHHLLVGEQGEVGIVLAQGFDTCQIKHIKVGIDDGVCPGRLGVPVLPRFVVVVLEISVLHHLGVKTTIGGTADILEEDAHQAVGYPLGLALVYGERGLYGLGIVLARQGFQLRGGLGQLFLGFGVELRHGVKPVLDISQMGGGHLEGVALQQLTGHRGGIPRPENILGLCLEIIFLKGAEVFTGRHITLALLGLQVDGERAVIQLIDGGSQYALFLHYRVILGPPGHQVFRVSHGEARRIVVHAPGGTPCTVSGLGHEGGIHLLLGSPLPVIGGAELSHLLPRTMLGEVGQTKSLVGGG